MWASGSSIQPWWQQGQSPRAPCFTCQVSLPPFYRWQSTQGGAWPCFWQLLGGGARTWTQVQTQSPFILLTIWINPGSPKMQNQQEHTHIHTHTNIYICLRNRLTGPGGSWQVWKPQSRRQCCGLEAGSLLWETSAIVPKAFNWPDEAHPHYGEYLLYSKSDDLNVNLTWKIPSQEHPFVFDQTSGYYYLTKLNNIETQSWPSQDINCFCLFPVLCPIYRSRWLCILILSFFFSRIHHVTWAKSPFYNYILGVNSPSQHILSFSGILQ